MKKLTELTEQQEQDLVAYRKEWINEGLRTDPIDQEKVKETIRKFYRYAGLEEPTQIIVTPSPYSTLISLKQFGCFTKDGSRFLKDQIWHHWHYGVCSGFWIAFYQFCAKIGVQYTQAQQELLDLHEEFARNAWWVLSYKNISFVSDRPSAIHMVSQNNTRVLHNPSGPALEFRDGYMIYALHGVRMEPWMVMTPINDISAPQVLKVQNVEQRRELIGRMGFDLFLHKSQAKQLDKQEDYELLEIPLGNDITGRFLKMKNPSIGVFHVEGVHPTCETIQQAHNWRASGNTDTQWQPAILT